MRINSAKEFDVYKKAYELAMQIFKISNSSLDFAMDCNYISAEVHKTLINRNIEIGKMLGSMIKNPESFLISNHN